MPVVTVRVDGEPAYSLVFDAVDLVARRPPDPAGAQVWLSVSSGTVREVAGGAVTGSAAAMADRLSIEGDRSLLSGLARVATGPRFRSYLACRPLPPGDGPDLVAVLGAPNGADGSLSRMASERCAAAVETCRGSPAAALVLCGGFGGQFNRTRVPHWRHCEAWITRWAGAHRPRIAGCVESRHTYEDVLLLRELAESVRARIVTVVTSDYHAGRVRFLLDIVLPGAELRTVGHPGLDDAERDRLNRHEREALARTVAAALVFGADRLPAGVVRRLEADRVILRPPVG